MTCTRRKLSAAQRQAIRAARAGGMSPPEISGSHGVPIATVYRVLRTPEKAEPEPARPKRRYVRRPGRHGLAGLREELTDPTTTPERRGECEVLIAEWERSLVVG